MSNILNPIVLKPFGNMPEKAASVLVTVCSCGDRLVLDYGVSGSDEVNHASRTIGQRVDGLWRHSCLELFVGTEEANAYWEYNFSTGGAWNCYAFTGYRQGMREEPEVRLLSFNVETREDETHFLIEVGLPSSIAGAPMLMCNPAAIIEKGSAFSYHAWCHPADKPDFHLKSARTVPVKG